MNGFLLVFPGGDPPDSGPEWVNEMDTPATAKELTSAILALGAKHRMDDFQAEFNEIAKSYGATTDSLEKQEYNPLVLLEEGRKEDYKRFIKQIEALDRKYSFQEFHDKACFLRTAFDQERKDYLYDSVLRQCAPIAFFFPPEIADQFFEQWLDGVFQQEESVLLEYENLDGKIIRSVVRHKEDDVTQDYVECRPIDRFVGDTPYDAFLVRYFWNDESGWIPVPIHLIKTYAVKR